MSTKRYEAEIDGRIADLSEKVEQLAAQTRPHTRETAEALDARTAELAETVAKYTGWSRFFLVTSSDGHIHRTLGCSTCYARTTFAWLTDLSGLSEAEAVADQGEILCSVCFPSAPVEWTTGTPRAKQEAKATRDAAKAERAAKKLAKALLPDGSPLKLRTQYAVTTLYSAKQELKHLDECIAYANQALREGRTNGHSGKLEAYLADRETLAAAIAAKLARG